MSKKRNDDNNDFTWISFLWRLCLAVILVFATFNPTGYSAYHWITQAIGDSRFGSVHAVAIALLAIGWTIVIVATWRALNMLGVVLVALALAAFVWLFVDLGVLKPHSVSAYAWVVLACLSILLAIGMCWSHLWRRLTGQYNVEDVDD